MAEGRLDFDEKEEIQSSKDKIIRVSITNFKSNITFTYFISQNLIHNKLNKISFKLISFIHILQNVQINALKKKHVKCIYHFSKFQLMIISLGTANELRPHSPLSIEAYQLSYF